MIKIIKAGLLSIVLVLVLISCKERYRTDRRNKMTRRAKVASNYLSAQAIKMTQENIKNKETTEKKNIKRKEKMQEELNELNAKSKVKLTKKQFGGKFNIY